MILRHRFPGDRALWPIAVLLAADCGEDAPDARRIPAMFGDADSAVIFAPQVISTTAPEFAATFTPNGSVLYFNRTTADRQEILLLESRYEDGRWTEPVRAPFSSTYRDVDPFVTPDGRRLYFSSTRPVLAGDSTADFNTWYMERTSAAWSEPVPLDAPLNTESQEVFVSVDAANTLFLASDRDGVQRIYRSRWSGDGHEAPQLVPFDLNRQGSTGNPLITRDGRMLIFVSDTEGGHGGADLYATCERDGEWSAAVNLGPIVNSASADFAPAITPDGRHLVFTSERSGIVSAVAAGERPPGDLFYVSLAALGDPCRA
jgi:Tol biopolymer transport system component